MSFGQESLWLAEALVPGLSAYTLPFCWSIGGELDVPALEQAIARLVDRHQVLRTELVTSAEGQYQRVREDVRFELARTDLSALPADAARAEVRRRVRRCLDEPFDLARAPQLTGELFCLGSAEHILVLVTHHAFSDEWSHAVLRTEISEHYGAALEHRDPDLPDLPVQYGDYARWQRLEVEPFLSEDLAYWTEQLADLPVLALPTDGERPATRRFAVAVCERRVEPALFETVARFARSLDTTPFVVLLAAFDVLMARWAGQDEVVVGTPVSGRDEPELAGLAGHFVNTVVHRVDCRRTELFHDLVRRVAVLVSDGLAHQQAPLHQVVQRLNPVRDMSRHPLFQVTFQVVPGGEPLRLPGLEVVDRFAEMVDDDGVFAEFDLVVDVVTDDSGANLVVRYATELFHRSTMEWMVDGYLGVLEQVMARPGTPVGTVEVATRSTAPVPTAGAGQAGPAPGDDRAAAATWASGPAAELRDRMCAIWAEMLELTEVDPDANFFEIGGGSLAGARLVLRMRESLGITVALVDLFDAGSVNGVLEVLAVRPPARV
ncbi:hypothetical protein BU204_25815 [Actinophytocola xanthii]|uniref:Carrier domain-containing protein n=1 Tax=Actinophytocola xanthii TaxID=1912961 RepID=A0A1Q8CK30_9PSEU|nr:hypothetical protein BU204_25815 [Actinophytocola xanthii]